MARRSSSYQIVAFCLVVILNSRSLHAFRNLSPARTSLGLSALRHRLPPFGTQHDWTMESRATRRSYSFQLYMARSKRINSLMEWAKTDAGINISNTIGLDESPDLGIGWKISASGGGAAAAKSGSLLITVPSDTALTVECPGQGPNDTSVKVDPKTWPWYVQMAVYLYSLQQGIINNNKNNNNKSTLDYRPWLSALPQSFDTPIHWSSLDQLQYLPMIRMVEKQRYKWNQYYKSETMKQLYPEMTNPEFIYWCEMARSRGFSGSYRGAAFSPSIYAFTLLLVTIYVGLNLGTFEQAANGAGVVLAVSILKDFVIPKFFQTKRYCICPMIDMANHHSSKAAANVSFEYFSNVYSLAMTKTTSDSELYISYGDRSNDQLLQYYGFVETDNPNDVYVLPPISEWDLVALETQCGRMVPSGRLAELANVFRANNDDNNIGVVVTRVKGMDPSALQLIRALFATEEEWDLAGKSIGRFQHMVNARNEACVQAVVATILTMELESKPTTIEQDERLLVSTKIMEPEYRLAIRFRMEKKKLLRDAISSMRASSDFSSSSSAKQIAV